MGDRAVSASQRLQRAVRPQGLTLGSVLFFVSLALLMAFTLAGTSFVHLSLAQAQSAQTRARQLAHSAVALASARLMESLRASSTLGATRSTADTVRLPASVAGDGSGVVAFDRTEAARLEIPYSTNNLASDATADGSLRPVPPHGIHLVGLGRVGKERAIVEAVLHVPPFPYAIAASGSIDSADGNVLVGSVPKGAAVPLDARGDVDVSKLLPGHLATNSAGRGDEKAVALGAGSRVTGDVLARGGVLLAPDAQVLGEVRTPVDPIDIPRIDLSAFDPRGRSDVLRPPEISDGALNLSGFARYAGGRPMTVTGDLLLDGGLLFVDGDLHVGGGLRGRGAVFATRSVTVDRGADVVTDSEVALVAGGSVTLLGTGRERSAFQGLVYSGGDFRAEEISLFGTFVTNGSTSELGSMRLRNTSIVGRPEGSRMRLTVKGPPSPASTDPVGDFLPQAAVGRTEQFVTPNLTKPMASFTPRLNEQGRRRCYDAATDAFRPPSSFTEADLEFVVGFDLSGQVAAQVCRNRLEVVSALGVDILAPFNSSAVERTVGELIDRFVRDARVGAEGPVQQAQRRYQEAGQQQDARRTGETVEIDLNRFIQPESTVRVLLWAER